MSPAMRQSLVVGALATLCALTVTLAVGAASRAPVVLLTDSRRAASADTSSSASGIVTSGDATVSKRPDVAFIGVGVESQGSTAAATQRDLAAKAARLGARVKSLGIPDKEINTVGYSIGPNYAPNGTLNGYRASEQLQLKWHNVDTTGNALDALVLEGGATNLSVSFGLADPTAAQAEARTLAIGDARTRATAMANAAGVRLGQVVRVADYTFGGRSPIAEYPASMLAASTQVPVGQLDVTVTVEVDFAIA